MRLFASFSSNPGRGSVVALLLLLANVSASSADEEVLLDGVAAQVGGEIVLISEIDELASPVEERMREAGAGPSEILQVRQQALQKLIESKLISNMVQRLEMEASAAEIDLAIERIARGNGMSVAQLEATVTSHGLTRNEYRGKLKGEIERSKVVDAVVRSRVRVEPEEIEAAYQERFGDQKQGGEEVHLRHILVMTGDSTARDERTACQIAQDAADQIRAGEMDFSEMARRITEMNPEQEGDLGWLHGDEIAPWMAAAIASLEVGEVSDAIPMPFGCNVLQLVRRRTFAPVTFEQAEASLRGTLSKQKMDREYMLWIDELRGKTFVSLKGAYAEDASRP